MNGNCKADIPIVRARTRQKGYTLVELLVAMTLFSLIVSVTYAGLRMASRSWEAGEKRTSVASDMRLLQSFLRRYLSRTYPLLEFDEGHWRLHFQGAGDQLSFVAENPSHLGLGGLYEITLAVKGADGGRRVIMVRRLLNSDYSGQAPVAGMGKDTHEETVLAAGLQEAKFSYFGRDQPTESPFWSDHWVERQALPELIRMRVTTSDGEAWPALVVRPRIDEPRYDQQGSRASGTHQRVQSGLRHSLRDSEDRGERS